MRVIDTRYAIASSHYKQRSFRNDLPFSIDQSEPQPPASVPPQSPVTLVSYCAVLAQPARNCRAMKRERVKERLSESQVLQLVKIYKQYDCLWDVSNENYKNREVRDKAYKEILEKLNIPGLKVSDIPQKIKNLRSSYYTELRKMESSNKEGSKTYKPKVAWFSIADEILRARNQHVWSQTVETTETESDAESSDAKTEKDNTRQTMSKRNKRTNKATVSQTTSTQRSEPQTKHEEDEFDVYGKYIAVSLRSMPEEMSIIARMELQKTMADMQLRALRQEKRNKTPVITRPSTSKMEENPLGDPPDGILEMEEDSYLSTVKIEDED